MNRPDYVKCVRLGKYTKPISEGGELTTESWCGRDTAHEWAFQDAAHAALHAVSNGYLLICTECSAPLIAALAKQTYEMDSGGEKT